MSTPSTGPSESQPSDTGAPPANGTKTPEPKGKRSISMHDGIAVWCDCCSCEAEPYWVEIGKEMGMELGSDYEDGDRS